MKIVKSTGKEQLRAHMPELVGCMLESLSSLEDTRLNYIEQHAERAGIRCATCQPDAALHHSRRCREA